MVIDPFEKNIVADGITHKNQLCTGLLVKPFVQFCSVQTPIIHQKRIAIRTVNTLAPTIESARHPQAKRNYTNNRYQKDEVAQRLNHRTRARILLSQSPPFAAIQFGGGLIVECLPMPYSP